MDIEVRKPLNASEVRIMEALAEFTETHGYPPTMREIANIVELSVSTVRIYYHRLKGRGLLAITPRTQRGVVIVKEKKAAVG